jgi:hypothetical protein
MAVDWDEVRRHAFHEDRPADWPAHVKAITIHGVALFGMDERRRRLFWDGREIIIRRRFALGTFERWIASLAAIGTVAAAAAAWYPLLAPEGL